MAGNTLRLGVQLDDGGVTKKLNGISAAFDRIGGKGSGASLFGNVGAKAVARGFDLISSAASGAIGFLDDAVRASLDDAASNAKLAQALKNNIPNWDGNVDAINRYTDAQINLGFSDDDTRDAIGQLIGVTHDQKEAMDLVTLAENLARAKGIDLATATDIVTKAHEGNGKALKALGIDVKGVTGAAGLLDAIQRNVAGSAENWANQTKNKLTIAQVKFNEAMERLGDQILPPLTILLQKLTDDWLPALGRGWDKVTTALRPVADFLSTIVGLISKAIGAIDRMIKKLKELNVASIAIPPIPGLGVLPHFAQGGMVPGPLNSPQLIVAHGGETVIPTGGGGGGTGVTIQGVSEREILDMVDRGLYFRLRRAAPAGGAV